MIIGRGPELAAVAAVLDSARAGRSAALCLEGEPGIGKTTLLDAAERAAVGFRCVRTTGVTADLGLPHAALLDVLLPLREHLDLIPAPQRDALTVALGWEGRPAAGDRYLVAAATLSLLAAAAERQPVLLTVDDVQWVDRESRVALGFAARRLGADRVAVLVAGREQVDDDLAGLPRHRLAGLAPTEVAELLRGQVVAALVAPLAAATGGNPLALGETLRGLSPEQRRGSAPLPDVLPVGDRIAAAFERSLRQLTGGAWRAVLLAAASGEPEVAPVVAALRAEGVDADAAIEEAERAGALVVDAGALTFAHPLVRAAVWRAASPAERRSAHAALARATAGFPDRAARHRAQAATGHDAELAARLEELAGQERERRGYAAASALEERAARLHPSSVRAAGARAAAVEDAFLSGDVRRVRELGAEVLAGIAGAAARARVLLVLGTLEQYAGSLPRARELLTDAAGLGEGSVRIRALAELATVSYRLGSVEAMTAAADALEAAADPGDPEHEMLACCTRSAALAFSGRWEEAYAPGVRALELLETDPVLRDEPRCLVWGVAAGWAGEPARGLASVDRRLDTARALGAVGVLPLALTLLAGGSMLLGEHQLGYAWAGEAVELGTELGYVADVAIGHELLAWQQAARGLHTQAQASLAESRRLSELAGVSAVAVHVHLVDAFSALCRGDLDRVVAVLERRLAADGGRLPRGDYPLGVAPELVEAYLGLGRRDAAAALAARHAELHRDSPLPDVRAHVARLDGLLAGDEAAADAAFAAAYEAHAAGSDPFEAARTRLLHGSRLRRAGRRSEAREQLRAAVDGFAGLGLDGWAHRARAELAATGLKARRGRREGDPLTSQETRVALLVARGLANREIAAALFLSPRTVEHHLGSVLRKRGLRSRTELAAAFAGGGADLPRASVEGSGRRSDGEEDGS